VLDAQVVQEITRNNMILATTMPMLTP